jgi:hypothetical protein
MTDQVMIPDTRIVTTETYDVLNVEAFMAWLEGQPDGEMVGRSRSDDSCPIATYLSLAGWSEAFADPDIYGQLTFGGEAIEEHPTPKWARAFMAGVDAWDDPNAGYDRPVTAAEARAILHVVLWGRSSEALGVAGGRAYPPRRAVRPGGDRGGRRMTTPTPVEDTNQLPDLYSMEPEERATLSDIDFLRAWAHRRPGIDLEPVCDLLERAERATDRESAGWYRRRLRTVRQGIEAAVREREEARRAQGAAWEAPDVSEATTGGEPS